MERVRRRRGGAPGKSGRHTYGEYWRWASGLPCVVCGVVDGAPADHWVPVGRGGRDYGNCLPICADHQGRHKLGEDTWAERWGVDVEAELERVREAWEAR